MATGDQDDFVGRLRSLLPKKWFPDQSPLLTALLSGFAASWAEVYANVGYVRAQSRILTATGRWLEGKAHDYLGAAWQRRLSETDQGFAKRTAAEILRPRNTREAIAAALIDLTGNAPVIVNPRRATDCGGYGVAGGYDTAVGAWGALTRPYEIFVTIARGSTFETPAGTAVGAGGYGSSAGGYGVGPLAYGSGISAQASVTDDEIYATVAATVAAGDLAWVRIVNAGDLNALWVLGTTSLPAVLG